MNYVNSLVDDQGKPGLGSSNGKILLAVRKVKAPRVQLYPTVDSGLLFSTIIGESFLRTLVSVHGSSSRVVSPLMDSNFLLKSVVIYV